MDFPWTLLVTCFIAAIIATHPPPRITPNLREITLIMHHSRVLQCTHSEPITWIVPDYAHSSLYFLSENQQDNSGHHYRNVSLVYTTPQSPAQTLVGSYYCLSKSLAHDDDQMTTETLDALYLDGLASRIFVFMKDTALKLAGSNPHILYASINSTVYFPCWPTDKSVQMRIYHDWALAGISYDQVLHLGARFRVTQELEFTSYRCISDTNAINVQIRKYLPPDVVIIDTFRNGYAKLNGDITLRCRTINTDNYDFRWTCPSGLMCQNNSQLSIAGLTKDDEGMYTCTVTNPKLPTIYESKSVQSFVKIIDQPEIIEFVPFQSVEYSFEAFSDLRITVRFAGVPEGIRFAYPIDIKPIRIRKTKRQDNSVTLLITKMQPDEGGDYIVSILNGTHTENMTFKVSITLAPSFSKDFASLNEMIVQPDVDTTVQFTVTGFPTAQVNCSFVECDLINFCSNARIVENNNNFTVITESASTATYKITLHLNKPGYSICVITNQIDSKEHVLKMLVMEKPKEFLLEPSGELVAGLRASLVCFASKIIYRNAINWELNKTLLMDNQTVPGVSVRNEQMPFMYKSTVEFDELTKSNEGSYRCQCRRLLKFGGIVDDVEYSLTLLESLPISVKHFDYGLLYGRGSLMLQCYAQGIPTPTLTWYKDHQPLATTEHMEITNTSLKINAPTPDDIGVYECRAENQFEEVSKTFDFRTYGNLFSTSFTITASVLLTLLLALLGMWLIINRRNRNQNLVRKKEFLVGNCKQINPALSLTDQADVLPYDGNYDFSAGNLELGLLLGAGSFGIVLKAKATGIVRGEETTTVAVKRVKEPVLDAHLKALIGEMKIMIHIGRHQNVIHLLGVVHENLISRGELLVITEYCGFGNLRDYVLRNRDFYVDDSDTLQDHKVGNNFIIGQSGDSRLQTIRINGISAEGVESNEAGKRLASVQDICQNEANDDALVEGSTITTTDLVCWSYQVAQGMNYLACKGVLHGDLAARNILLTTDSVVKICDFGLSRKMRPEENYEKESSNTALPLKWLAIESMESKVFNSSSDVWSFGVMMWELFSLSGVPYFDIRNEDLLAWLKDGHRLCCPMYATSDIHRIMLDCWKSVPEDRPRFNELGKRIAEHLPKDLVQIFEDTNATYVALNDEKYYGMRYSQMMATPNQEAVATEDDFHSQLTDVVERVAESIPMEDAAPKPRADCKPDREHFVDTGN